MSTAPMSHDPYLRHDEQTEADSHNLIMGYAMWCLGFFGLHRFYYGRPLTGALWFFTLGLLFVGWILDFFTIPQMQEEAERRAVPGPIDYSIAWLLLIFIGYFGVHRFYQGKWVSGIIYALTGGLFGVGIVYDFCTLNEQVSEVNLQYR